MVSLIAVAFFGMSIAVLLIALVSRSSRRRPMSDGGSGEGNMHYTFSGSGGGEFNDSGGCSDSSSTSDGGGCSDGGGGDGGGGGGGD
jgi:hypothetical protein